MLRNRMLLSVSLAVCAAYIGLGMIVPVRVLYAQSQGASLAIIGAMASAYLISNFLFQYPSGWLADRWGRKPMMMGSLLAQAALSLLYLFLSDPILFVVLRFVEGMAAAAFLPSARAQITDSIPAEKRGEAFGIFGAFMNAGFLLGPALGGLLAGTGYVSAFLGAVVFRLVGLVVVLLLIRPGVQQRQTTQEETLPFKTARVVCSPLVRSVSARVWRLSVCGVRYDADAAVDDASGSVNHLDRRQLYVLGLAGHCIGTVDRQTRRPPTTFHADLAVWLRAGSALCNVRSLQFVLAGACALRLAWDLLDLCPACGRFASGECLAWFGPRPHSGTVFWHRTPGWLRRGQLLWVPL